MPQILSKEIRNRIVSGGENKMYTISDFADLNNDSLVTRVLSWLEVEGMLVRLTQGLYLYPKQTRFGIVKPTPLKHQHGLGRDWLLCIHNYNEI